MKKFLRLFSVVLTIALSLTLFACNGGEDNGDGGSEYNTVPTLNGMTTEDVYEGVITTVESYRDNFTISIQYDVACKTTAQGTTLNMNMKMTDYAKFVGDEFYEKVYIDLGEMTYSGETMDLGETTVETSVVGGYAYLYSNSNIMGETISSKQKFGATLQQIAEFADLDLDKLINPIYDFSQHSFDDVKFNINKNDASDIYFEMTITDDAADDYAEDIASNFGELDMEVGNINYKFIINEQAQLDHVEVKFTMTAEVSGMVMEYAYSGSVRFSDVGTTVITAPADADTYTDLGSIESII